MEHELSADTVASPDARSREATHVDEEEELETRRGRPDSASAIGAKATSRARSRVEEVPDDVCGRKEAGLAGSWEVEKVSRRKGRFPRRTEERRDGEDLQSKYQYCCPGRGGGGDARSTSTCSAS